MTHYCSPGVKCENVKDERQWTPNNTLGSHDLWTR
jgi:hypothetical protein